MTDRLRSRERTLPEGFQFGDGVKQPSVRGRSGALFLFDDETSAARFADLCADPAVLGFAKGWNVIEGEHFASGALLVEKCTEHGRERVSDCAECQSLPRLETRDEA